jgi:hypothetical protein
VKPKRSAGQVLVNFYADTSLVDAVAAHCEREEVSKSEFIRTAIFEALPEDLRRGVKIGSPARFEPRYPPHIPQFSRAEDRPAATAPSAGRAAADTAADHIRRAVRKIHKPPAQP